MLASALGRYGRHGALDHLEQGLLDAFTRDVAGDGWIVSLGGDLVDLVDIDDALLGALDVIVGILEKVHDDVLNVLTDVPGFRQGGGIRNGERDIEDLGQGLREQGLA